MIMCRFMSHCLGTARLARGVPTDGRGMDVSQSTFEQTLLFNRDPEALSTPFRMLRRSMSNMWRSNGRMVRAGWTHSER